ncbi:MULTISPECIES: hypothetical protein [Klebsiella]|uniref:hypothetical protein n=1 Tax=Klebsiella TaxID=570 RepID=UPI000E2C96DF|nr:MULTISPECIES: hypothetical protein [Klebsiella]MBS5208590.1 hypothetical protein [Klebsiella sp.]MBZ6645241.1 hypothetical protein [Klebsiella michiganensis]MCI7942319.1 hypothetical protein [Klebsiella pneumoniae]SWD61087.1 Uncharacterised protein [Klebsiella pneumoniae]HBK4616632.1 hypothetical protein [Klebsiella michiganensis]
MFDKSLLDLPWPTLVTLAAGYIGYFVANVGVKDQHKAVDITFSALVFGLFSAGIYHASVWGGINAYMAAFPAVMAAFVAGSCWRKYGRKWMYSLLRKYDISWSDDTSSAWQAMFGHTQYRVTEIFVYLKDGSGLLSRLPGNYEEWPNGPFTLGNHGDISLYVTHRKSINGEAWEEYEGVVHQSWGALATWVPADQIARVDIRRKRA